MKNELKNQVLIFNVIYPGRAHNIFIRPFFLQVGQTIREFIPSAEFLEVEEQMEAQEIQAEQVVEAVRTGMSPPNIRGPMNIGRLAEDTGFEPGLDLRQGTGDYINCMIECRQLENDRRS